MRMFILIIMSLILSAGSVTFAQSLDEKLKRGIVRIETPEGLGTGFILSDSVLGFFLVTNKHMVKSYKTQEYFDSVFVRKNILEAGKVVATNEKATLYLRFRGKNLFKEYKDASIDLIIIKLGPTKVVDTVFFNPANYMEWTHGFKMKMVANRKDIDSLGIKDGTYVQLVGFSFTAPQKPQFHVSRFGHIALFAKQKITMNVQVPIATCKCRIPMTAEWIIIDITSRRGDSGGPVFVFPPKSKDVWVVGLVQGGSDLNEFCLAHPSYYIWDLVELVREGVGK